MRTPPRAKKCQEIIDDLEFNLDYFMGGEGDELKKLKKKMKYLREYINEISEEKKLHDIKLATKIKKEIDVSSN